jgi:hypothetical protein
LKSGNPQLRGVVAEVLAQSPTGCEEVRAQASLETEAWRSRFARGCVAPGASAGKADTGPANLSASTTGPVTAAAATSGGQYIIPLGSFAVFTNQLSSPITVNLPANAISFEFIGQPADPTARVVVYRIIDPDGITIYNYASAMNIVKILPTIRPGSFSVLLPNSPTVPFKPGPWTFYLLGAKATTAAVQAVYKTSTTDPGASTIDANLFFVGVPNLSAKSAPTDPNFQTILSTVRSIYSQVGVTLGNLTYIDITGKDATTFTDVTDSEFGSLLQLSNHPQARAAAVNIFLVHSITGPTLNGFIILGESGGIPGTPVRGSTGSGVAFSLADFPNGLDELGRTVAHEIGHWLGLFHTTESDGLSFDPLPDTPECPLVPFDTDHDFIMQPQECITRDATDLMFWTDVNSIPANLLTPDQGFVMLRNPVQNADFAALKVPPIPPTPPTPPAIRVPEDFATIQQAADFAIANDTIRVGPGRWCGAWINTPLNLVGEGATIMGCPADTGPVLNGLRVGFVVSSGASGNSIIGSGTSISGFVFDGVGFSDTNLSPLAIGVRSRVGANDLVVDSNTFLGGGYGVVVSGGNGTQVTHNVFDGFTELLSTGFGGAAIEEDGLPPEFGGTGRVTGNVIQFNTITSTVPPGDFSSFSCCSGVDAPFVGIVVTGQDGTIISNNKFSITSNAHGDAGVGIVATDFFGLTDINLAITDNDGRGSQYGLIVTNDQSGGTGNSVGLTLRGNFGVNLINGSTFNVRNRSISTLLQCDPTTGVCP